jgi:hypothetical protein
LELSFGGGFKEMRDVIRDIFHNSGSLISVVNKKHSSHHLPNALTNQQLNIQLLSFQKYSLSEQYIQYIHNRTGRVSTGRCPGELTAYH